MMERRGAPLALILGAGLGLAAACTAAGYLALGMGHGWDLPARFGAFSFLLYPLALARWRWVNGSTPWRADIALTAAVAIPMLLVLALFGWAPHPGRIASTGWATLVILAAVYWWVGRVLASRGLQAAWGSGVLLAIGVALDLLALGKAATDTRAWAAGVLILPWIPLWLGWQVAAALATVRQLRPRRV